MQFRESVSVAPTILGCCKSIYVKVNLVLSNKVGHFGEFPYYSCLSDCFVVALSFHIWDYLFRMSPSLNITVPVRENEIFHFLYVQFLKIEPVTSAFRLKIVTHVDGFIFHWYIKWIWKTTLTFGDNAFKSYNIWIVELTHNGSF